MPQLDPTLASEWQNFSTKSIPANMPEHLRTAIEMSFYAGALVYKALMYDIARRHDDAEEADADVDKVEADLATATENCLARLDRLTAAMRKARHE